MSGATQTNGGGEGLLFSLDMERAILGAILSDSSAYLRAAVMVQEGSFYRAPHRTIWKCLSALHARGVPIDLITAAEELRRVGKLDEAGGMLLLTELAAEVPTSANLEHYCGTVAEYALKREYQKLAFEIKDKLNETATRADEVSSLISARVTQALSRSSTGKTLEAGPLAAEVIRDLSELVRSGRPFEGLATGFPALDRKLRGLKPGLHILAARPSMGKSQLAFDIGLHVAKVQKIGVGVISMEMPGRDVMKRLLCSESSIPGWRLDEGALDRSHFERLNRAGATLGELPIVIQDEAGLGIIDVLARGQAMKLRDNIGLLIVDYLQLITPKNKEEAGNPNLFVAAASKALKNLSRQLELPVLCLSQLSRATETRGGDRKPILSDLRDSGAIEQDADSVTFIHRAEYYKGLTKKDREEINGVEYNIEGLAEVIVAKHRNGETGSAALHFERQFPRFANFDTRETAPGYYGERVEQDDSKPF